MFQNDLLQKYISKFEKLRQGVTKYGQAPHKPVLLLAIVRLIEKGEITENRIYLTPELVAEFMETFKLLVQTGNRAEFTLPFYYLATEGFWYHQLKSDKLMPSYIKSLTVLNDTVEFAYFDAPLFDVLSHAPSREILKQTILDTYFPTTKDLYKAAQLNTDAYISQLKQSILNEPSVRYGSTPLMPLASSRLGVTVFDEEERFVRGGLFKKMIPKLYDYTCSITRMKVISTHNYQLIDACHIKPLSISNDDTVSNGFALCPTLHRAFDRGIIGVNEQYRVVVSRHIKENDTAYGLKKLEGVELYLPMPKAHFPLVENFLWHLGNRFEK